jgi:hypothetical protein
MIECLVIFLIILAILGLSENDAIWLFVVGTLGVCILVLGVAAWAWLSWVIANPGVILQDIIQGLPRFAFAVLGTLVIMAISAVVQIKFPRWFNLPVVEEGDPE